MRTLIVVAVLLVGSGAFAQTPPATDAPKQCFPSSHIDKVVVQMADGTTRRGSLLCMGAEDFTLVGKQAVGQIRLEDVRQIRKAADPVWDGAAKGASVSLIMLILCAGHCPAAEVARVAAAYGLLGLALDAIDTNADTIYRPSAGKRAAVGFRVRF